MRVRPVHSPSKAVEHCFAPASADVAAARAAVTRLGAQLEDSAVAEFTAAIGCTVEIAFLIQDQWRRGTRSITRDAPEAIKERVHPPVLGVLR